MMAIYDGFFDATLNEETEQYEPSYDSDDFSEYFGQFIGSGVCIYQNATSMAVRFSEGAAIVSPGYLFIDGYWLKNDADYSITLTGAGTFAILAHLNLGTPAIELKAESKANPEVYPDSLVLAYVTVSGGSGTVEDTRHNTNICGVIDAVGNLSGKLEYALNYIDTEIEAKLEQAEADIEAQAAELDAKIAEVAGMVERLSPPPIGSIKFSAAEQGNEWLKCDGSFVSEDDYPELVAALGKLIPSGDKFSLISNGEIGPQISNGVLYNGRMWVYSHAAKKLYGVDVNGVQPVKEISVTRNSTYKDFVSPALEFPISLSIVPHSAYTKFNWTENSLPTNYEWSAVAYGGGKYVAVAKGSSVAAYSTDGDNWTMAELPSSEDWAGVAYGNGVFVAVSKKIAYSSDGAHWENSQSDLSDLGSTLSLNAVTYGNKGFVAVTKGWSSGGRIVRSADGITWTVQQYSSNFFDVAYTDGSYFAVTITSHTDSFPKYYEIYVLGDSGEWEVDQFPYERTPIAVACGNNTCIVLCVNGIAYRKVLSGGDWELCSPPDIWELTSDEWSRIKFAGGKFICISPTGDIAISDNGSEWGLDSISDSKNMTCVAGSEDELVFTASNGYNSLKGSKVSHSAGASVFLGQNLKNGTISGERYKWMDSFLLYFSEFSENGIELEPPFAKLLSITSYERYLDAILYVSPHSDDEPFGYDVYIGRRIITFDALGYTKDAKIFNSASYTNDYQRSGFSHKNKGEVVCSSIPNGRVESYMGGLFSYTSSYTVNNRSKRTTFGPAIIAGENAVISAFLTNFVPVLRRGSTVDLVVPSLSLPSSARVFVDAGAYLWGKDMYMIFVGTGIIFSRDLSAGSFGYLDTTPVLGVITQFGYLDYAEDEGTLYLMGQDTSNQVKVAKMKLDTLFDYASNGVWLPTMSMDGIPAYIRVKEETTA